MLYDGRKPEPPYPTDEDYHRTGMEHACALLSLTVYDSDGEPLDQTKLLAMCDEADAALMPEELCHEKSK